MEDESERDNALVHILCAGCVSSKRMNHVGDSSDVRKDALTRAGMTVQPLTTCQVADLAFDRE